MAIKAPSTEQIVEVGAQLGMSLSEDEASPVSRGDAAHARGLRRRGPPWRTSCPRSEYPRVPGHRPTGEENPHNGWYWKTAIKGAAEGPLAGKRVGIKDNVCVAGVPMMNGASVLEGYVPEVDATVVSRILDAGGEIAGKTACEYLCFSGASHTNATGNPVHNPWKHGYTSGGSSSGSGAVVAAGDVQMAIGGDQGGSIRIPASMCGIVGLKPTHGLVPYTGVMPIELTIDHVGPMTDTVANNALLLEAIAGSRRARPAPDRRAGGPVLHGRARPGRRRDDRRRRDRRLRPPQFRSRPWTRRSAPPSPSTRRSGRPCARSTSRSIWSAARSGPRSGSRARSTS